ncbi:MAG TPA: chloride channel protein [Polyangia bacterium]|nr:chloride channel protein [Polyangia bacterium]
MLAIVLGVVAGFGALALRVLIAVCHNLLFLGHFSIEFDANQHTAVGPYGAAVALAPALGALAVVFLVDNFAPEAKGHGVPEVMDAIYYNKGAIRPVVAAVKALASAISIGSGGSVGREGPIIQIGAAFGSWAGRSARVSRWQIATLVAAGGGAGIAATFNTPIGGVLFAVEILLHEVSVRTLVPVALATATATYVGHFLFGDHPAFAIPALHAPATATVGLLPAYVCLGSLMAIVATVFIRAIYGAEDLFDKSIRNPYVRHVVGMLGVGLMAEGAMLVYGHFYVAGVGYATIMDILTGALTSAGFLAALFVAKLVATSLTLGSGASGGVFSPALFMGATFGGAYGLVLRDAFPALHADPVAFALAGMGGLVAGTTGAALTAIVMLFEMTLDYSVVLPMTLTVAVSYGLRRALNPDSIYTTKLRRRGHPMPWALQANAHLVHHVTDLALQPADVLPGDTPGHDFDLDDEAGAAVTVLVTDGAVVGVLSRSWALAHRELVTSAAALSDVARADWVTVAETAAIFEVLASLRGGKARVAVVVSSGETGVSRDRVRGIITLSHLAEAMADGMEIFGD